MFDAGLHLGEAPFRWRDLKKSASPRRSLFMRSTQQNTTVTPSCVESWMLPKGLVVINWVRWRQSSKYFFMINVQLVETYCVEFSHGFCSSCASPLAFSLLVQDILLCHFELYFDESTVITCQLCKWNVSHLKLVLERTDVKAMTPIQLSLSLETVLSKAGLLASCSGLKRLDFLWRTVELWN